METRTLPEVLAQEGIADLTGLWPVEQGESWNQRVDSLFAAMEDQPHAVLGPDQLVDVGVFPRNVQRAGAPTHRQRSSFRTALPLAIATKPQADNQSRTSMKSDSTGGTGITTG